MVVIVMGVCGCGKTTVARALSEALNFPFLEGDSFHSAENVQKMSSGTPLTESDRQPWLAAIRQATDEAITNESPVVITCSALTAKSREILGTERSEISLIFLHGSPSVIADRLAERTGHYMPPELLASQFETLEPPSPDEAIHISIDQSPAQIVSETVSALRR